MTKIQHKQKPTVHAMKVSEAFLVNTSNFDAIIDTLAKNGAADKVINSALLENLGFSDPNDLLVVRILKDYNIIDNEGKPGKYYKEFINAETTKLALAKGLVTAYQPLFDQDPKLHQETFDHIKKAFEDYFSGKKTDLIIKYISSTFQKVATYTGSANIDKALAMKGDGYELETAAVKNDIAKTSSNGVTDTSEEKSGIKREDISNKNIDDIVNDFDAKKSNLNVSEEDEDEVSDEETELTIREYVKDEGDTEDENPFDFEEEEDSTEASEATDKTKSSEKTNTDEQIDVDPFDLDTPLSTATQIPNAMENLTAEHQFVQKALLRKSDLLQKMERWEDLVTTLEEIINRYDNEEHVTLKDAVSRSIIRRATALLKMNKTDKALSALNVVIDRFEDSEKKEYYDQASRAMLYKVSILEKKGDDDLFPLYNSIIDRLDSSSEILMKEKLDEIHLKRFDLIISRGADTDILDASSKIIERFKGKTQYSEYLQKAMIKRAELLDRMGRDEEALAAYDEFLTEFGQ